MERFAVAAKVANCIEAAAPPTMPVLASTTRPPLQLTPALAFARLVAFSPVGTMPYGAAGAYPPGWTRGDSHPRPADRLRRLPEPVALMVSRLLNGKPRCQRRYAGGSRFCWRTRQTGQR